MQQGKKGRRSKGLRDDEVALVERRMGAECGALKGVTSVVLSQSDRHRRRRQQRIKQAKRKKDELSLVALVSRRTTEDETVGSGTR